jgi:hypothetical protein
LRTKLAKMMQKPLSIFFVIVILMPACKIDRKEAVDRDKFTFRTTNEAFLFFQNVRQIYYDVQDLPEARWRAYRLGDRNKSVEHPVLTPVIVVNWYKDEAYLLLESNEPLQDESVLVVQEKNKKNGRLYEYSLKERGRGNMLEFATKIYEGIMAENEIKVRVKDNFVPLFSSDEDLDNFRIVLSDYYRLTHIF